MRPRMSVARCCCDGGGEVEPQPGEEVRPVAAWTAYWYSEGTSIFEPNTGSPYVMGQLSQSFGGTHWITQSNGVRRFDNVDLEQGEQIFSAKLVWTPVALNLPWPCTTPATLPFSYGDSAGACVFGTTVRLQALCEDADNATTLGPNDGLIADALPRTSGQTKGYKVAENGNGDGAYAITDDVEKEFADVTIAVQAVINRPGWSRFNSIQFFADEHGSDAELNPGGYGSYFSTTTLFDLVVTRRA